MDLPSNNWMAEDWQKPTDNIDYLLDLIVSEVPDAPFHEGNPQMQITSLDYSKYTGRIAIGQTFQRRASHESGLRTLHIRWREENSRKRTVCIFSGLGKEKVDSVRAGDICAINGIEGFEIGDTISDLENPEPIDRIAVDEPTMSLLFTINTSPFLGKDGEYLTSRHIRERLDIELQKNLALRVEATDSEDKWNVYGRGILHLICSHRNHAQRRL